MSSEAGALAGRHRVRLEIQSGDVIVVEGSGVEWTVEADRTEAP